MWGRFISIWYELRRLHVIFERLYFPARTTFGVEWCARVFHRNHLICSMTEFHSSRTIP